MKENTVIIIVGPTAVGKTAAAVELARRLGTQIISADSRQCYRELNIGVAKPSPRELGAVHHYFIDAHSILEDITAATFESEALAWAETIFHTAPVAVMVGGTGLYIKAFEEGLDAIPPVHPEIRQRLLHLYELEGLGGLQVLTSEEDPLFYQEGEMQNPQRVLRALEVKLSTGHSILSFRSREKKQRPFVVRKFGLSLPKETLHARINARVDQMMEQGLLEEVRQLEPYRKHNALQTVGYSELFAYLDGEWSLEAAVEEIKKNTRRYAKRQLTWFRKDPAIQWVDAEKDNLSIILS